MSDTIEQPISTQEPGEDLRSVLGAAYDEVMAKEEPSQPRDETGRFASQKADADPAPAEESTDQPETEAEQPQDAAIEPPKSWSAEDRAAWAELPRKAQETILRREMDADRALSERDQRVKDLEPLAEVLAPYRESHARMGLPQSEAVARALGWAEAIQRNPDQAFRALMQSVGYDPNRLFHQPQANEVAPRDPELDALRAELAAIKQHTEAQDMQSTAALIDAFAKDPSHLHFEAVRQDMAMLIKANGSLSLQDAYDRAIWANPAVREKLRAEERAKEVEAQRKATAEQAARARRAATSVRDSSSENGARSTSSASSSLRADLERAWDEAAHAA